MLDESSDLDLKEVSAAHQELEDHRRDPSAAVTAEPA